MREEPAARQLRKTPVKTCVGPRRKDVNQSRARKAKSQQTSRNVDPVRPSKRGIHVVEVILHLLATLDAQGFRAS